MTQNGLTPGDALSRIMGNAERNRPHTALSPRSQQVRDTKIKAKIEAKLEKMFPTNTAEIPKSSADDVLDAYNASADANHANLRTGRVAGSIAGRMLMPSDESSGRSQRQTAARLLADAKTAARRTKRTVRSRPALGRTIEVEPGAGTDFGQAIRKLAILVALNKVKSDSKRQKYHERAGAKRKRLKSERWRRYFNAGFQATVGRVKIMRRQGW